MTAVLLSLIASLLAALLGAEARAWAPKLIDYSLALALKRIRSTELRQRMREEWSAHLEELPGTVARVLTALGFYFAANRLVERAPLGDRIGTTFLALRVSARLLVGNVARCVRERSALTTMFLTVELIGQIWRLLGPSIGGEKPREYAQNIMSSIVFALRVISTHEGTPDELQAKLAGLKIDPDTGSLNPRPSSARQ